MRWATRGSSSSPVTSASMSRASHAIGSTRPRAPTSAPTSSSAATGSSSTSSEAGEQQVAHGVPGERAGAAEAVLQEPDPGRSGVRGPAASEGAGAAGVGGLLPARAARAIRRSPGGSRPSSRRRRPDEPPSSATVTTAVTGSTTPRSASSRSAARVACRPCPPPRATAASGCPITQRRPVDPCGAGSVTAHSRPRSRCVTRTAMPSASASRLPISSLIATLRCLPPVQPTASVR